MEHLRFSVIFFVISLLFLYISCDENDIDKHPNWEKLPTGYRCGVGHFDDRIFGGNRASLGKYPWMARLQYLNIYGSKDELKFGCGGTLIGKTYVITAAHCQPSTCHKLVAVRLGENFDNNGIDCEKEICAPEPQDIPVKNIIMHSEYDDQVFHNDIALVILEYEAVFNDFVYPICLPKGTLLNRDIGAAEIAGWGETEESDTSNSLMFVVLPIKDNEFCKGYFEKPIVDSQICVGEGKGLDSCTGDSGGPLMRPMATAEGPRYFLFGVVSFGKSLCGIAPALYTKVTYFMKWILDNINDD